MYWKQLRPGKEINLFVLEGPYKGKYSSEIRRVTDYKVQVVSPSVGSTVIRLPEGTKVAINFTDDVCAYLFETTVLGYSVLPFAELVLELPEQFTRIQRREYVRAVAIYPLFFRLIKDEGEASDWIQGNTLDLSGGGISFVSRERLETDAVLELNLFLPSGESKAMAVVRRCLAAKDPGKYHTGAKFVSIAKRDREIIIRSVFELQRIMRRKGLK